MFEAMAIEPSPRDYTLTGQGEPREILGGRTTAGFWKVLGIRPAIGRFSTDQDDVLGAAPVAVITWETWNQRFGHEPGILGETTDARGPLNSHYRCPSTRLRLSRNTCEFFSALQDTGSLGRKQHQYDVVARLKPAISVEQAQSDMNTIARRLEQSIYPTNTGWGLKVRPLRAALGEELRTPALVMSAVVVSCCCWPV